MEVKTHKNEQKQQDVNHSKAVEEVRYPLQESSHNPVSPLVQGVKLQYPRHRAKASVEEEAQRPTTRANRWCDKIRGVTHQNLSPDDEEACDRCDKP